MQPSTWNDTNQQRPFVTTDEKYNTEYATGKLTGSNFPYQEVQSLLGYAERRTPGLSGSDVTKELARYLAEYAEREGCPLPYPQRDIAGYLWEQASRSMLAWDQILNAVRAKKKRYRHKPIAHYFGYCPIIEKYEPIRIKIFIKLIRYVTQEGKCPRCRTEYRFDDLTVDHRRPRKAGGEINLSNAQLMCQPCNVRKGATWVQQETLSLRADASSLRRSDTTEEEPGDLEGPVI